MTPRVTVFSVLLLLTTVTSQPLEDDQNLDKRIVDGKDAKPHAFPSIVSLQWSWGRHFCGGSLISESWILTAAHCVKKKIPAFEKDRNAFKAVLGEHDRSFTSDVEKEVFWEKIEVHDGYKGYYPYQHDIALIKLREPVTTNKTIQFASLSRNSNDHIEEDSCLVVGWGRSSWNAPSMKVLQQSHAIVKPYSVCREIHWRLKIFEDQVCVQDSNADGGLHSSACRGDSGGPLMCGEDHKTVKGVASWVYRQCDGSRPNVYTKVSGYIDWIEKFTGPLLSDKKDSSSGCAPGFKNISGVCYAAFKEHKKLFSAMDSCFRKGAFLVEPKSIQDMENIKNVIRDNQIDGPVWLGFYRGTSNQWVTLRSAQPVQYTDWAKGEPNNFKGVGGEGERCVELWTDVFKWNDAFCDNRLSYICEKM